MRGVRREVREFAPERRVGLMRSHAANELATTQPAWPPADWLKDRDRPPVDRDRYLLTGLHAI